MYKVITPRDTAGPTAPVGRSGQHHGPKSTRHAGEDESERGSFLDEEAGGTNGVRDAKEACIFSSIVPYVCARCATFWTVRCAASSFVGLFCSSSKCLNRFILRIKASAPFVIKALSRKAVLATGFLLAVCAISGVTVSTRRSQAKKGLGDKVCVTGENKAILKGRIVHCCPS